MAETTQNSQDSGDTGVLMIDERTRAVMTDHPRHAQEAFREQIARVREVVPNSNKDDIALVVQYHDGDVDKAIQSFMEDGAKTVLNEWQSLGKKGKSASRRNKKKRRAQQTGEGADSQAAPPQGSLPPSVPLQEKGSDAGEVGTGSSSSNAGSVSQVGSHGNATPSDNHFNKSGRDKPQQFRDRPQQFRDRPQQSRDRPQQSRDRPQQSRDKPQQSRERPQYSRDRPQQSQPRQYPQGRREDHNRSKSYPREDRVGDGKHQPSTSTNQAQSESSARNDERNQGSRGKFQVTSEERLNSSHQADKRHVPADVTLLHVHDTVKAKKLGAVLEKSSKDLHRTSAALTRHKNLLKEKLEQSEKSIAKSFDEISRFLTERQLDVTNSFLAVKQETTEMLEGREEQARELDKKTLRAAAMSEDQLMELRAEIKQFVSDRKVDEEIGKTLRYTWNPDQLIEQIKTFGEVVPVHHHYTTRRPSVSSLSSINTVSRTTSLSEDPGALSSRSMVQGDSHELVSPRSPTGEIDMKAEVAEMAARLQRSLTQGRKGPRNPKAANQPDGNQTKEQSQRVDRSKPQKKRPESSESHVRGQSQSVNQDTPAQTSGKQQGRNQARHDRSQGQHGSKQGQQGSKPRPVSHQGQGSQLNQGQKQSPVPAGSEQIEPVRSNKNVRRRHKNRRRQEELGAEKTDAVSRNSEDIQEGVESEAHTGVTSSKRTESEEAVSEVKVTQTENKSDSVKSQDKQVMVKESSKEEEEKKEGNTKDIVLNHLGSEKGDQESLEVKNRDEKSAEEEPKMVNGHLVNGDIHPVNGAISNGEVEGHVDAPLPQRETKSRRSQKVDAVVKETTSLNGVIGLDVTEREN
ncbi:uncharacterized protein [Diadema setosum]|uniref:uncharacterized protein isoform X2 n=1 Tax=Diadema setosum TaxID=31175 RepID=UPI003B3A5457